MKLLEKIKKAIKNPLYLTQGIARRCCSFIKDDKLYLSIVYFAYYGKVLNWSNPKLFSEKMQWLKLYNRKPEYVIMADKIKAKEWVASIIGKEYIIPTLGVWDNVESIDFSRLPNKFVIKCNHNSGTGMCICTNKAELDFVKVKNELKKGLNEDYYRTGREWPYKDIPRMIIAEQFMEDKSNVGDLTDYKFFCFNGVPKFCQVIRDRSTCETIDIYDMDWKKTPFVGLNPDCKNGKTEVPRPSKLDIMVDICKKLAYNKPFTRVDLYVINDNIYFGELTFFPMNGWGRFTPTEWNLKIGNMLDISNNV